MPSLPWRTYTSPIHLPWLVRGDSLSCTQLKGQMAKLREENAALAAALASAKAEGDEARSAAGTSGAELAGLRDSLAALQKELSAAK